MKRHLSFVAALSIGFFASITAAYAQQISAETGSIAIGGSVTGSTINMRLGERETGTASLEEAVAVCQEALKEQTRERAPLQWARTQHILGMTLADEVIE